MTYSKSGYANAGWQQWADSSADLAQQMAASASDYSLTSAVEPVASADTTYSYTYEDPNAYLAATGLDAATYAQYAAAYAASKLTL